MNATFGVFCMSHQGVYRGEGGWILGGHWMHTVQPQRSSLHYEVLCLDWEREREWESTQTTEIITTKIQFSSVCWNLVIPHWIPTTQVTIYHDYKFYRQPNLKNIIMSSVSGIRCITSLTEFWQGLTLHRELILHDQCFIQDPTTLYYNITRDSVENMSQLASQCSMVIL